MRLLLCLLVTGSLSAQSPYLVKDLVTTGPAGSAPRRFQPAADWLYFEAMSVHNGLHTLWRSDGTPEGTVQVLDGIPNVARMPAVGRTLFFIPAVGPSGLWMSDGTPQGTRPATEFAGRFFRRPEIRFVLGDVIFAFSNDDLWVTKLAPGSPVVGLGTGDASRFVEAGGRAFFVTDDHENFPEAWPWSVWSSDGTRDGTALARTFTDPLASGPVAMGGEVWFIVGGASTRTLWRSNGTPEGTVAAVELPKGGGDLAAGATRLFFLDRDRALWVSDGSAAGTRELPAQPNQWGIHVLGDAAIFGQSVATRGELWVSDGTAAGTRELYDYPSAQGNRPVSEWLAAGGRSYFSGADLHSGLELWSTDGTTPGTRAYPDIEFGGDGSLPEELRRAGNRLFFSAWTSTHGRELWAFDLEPHLAIGDVRLAEAETTARFTVSLSPPAAEPVTVAFATANGTAGEGSDYDPASGTLAFAAGETSKTVEVRVRADDAVETHETFLVTLRDPSGATIGRGAGAGIIEDDDGGADAGLALDFSTPGEVVLSVTNRGPKTATNLRTQLTGTSWGLPPAQCPKCFVRTLGPDAREEASRIQALPGQQFFTATTAAREPDPDPANNAVAWTANDRVAMDALYLTAGEQATVWTGWHLAGTARIESSDPSVVAVPASIEVPADGPAVSFVARGLAPGLATIRVSMGPHDSTLGTLDVAVAARGAQPRWPGAFGFGISTPSPAFDAPVDVRVFPNIAAPFTNATATGEVTIRCNGSVAGRLTLAAGSPPEVVRLYMPRVGENTLTFEYPGDASFFPLTQTWTTTVERGQPTLVTRATRHGTQVRVRVRVEGSPAASPGGTVRVSRSGEIPLTDRGQGLAEAEVILEDVAATTTLFTARYSGDERYVEVLQQVQIPDRRRRAARQ